VYRDLNKDYKRTGDAVFEGSQFGINQHWGYDHPEDNVGAASAGCLVGRSKDEHREFMRIIKGDPRIKASQGYRFLTMALTCFEWNDVYGGSGNTRAVETKSLTRGTIVCDRDHEGIVRQCRDLTERRYMGKPWRTSENHSPSVFS
jgi:hypothetical protein